MNGKIKFSKTYSCMIITGKILRKNIPKFDLDDFSRKLFSENFILN